ncbi:MAG: SWIM zinc finger family protein [Alkalibacterium sp.]|nr:SWIM zinc finger family protein [Alkalibacterium sp.]
MKKQTFPEMTLTSLASNYPTFLQGKELYKKGSVTNLKVDEKNNTVQTSVEDKQLETVHLRFYPNGVARKYHCTCKAFEKNTGACRHVVASMMHLNDLDASDLEGGSTAAKSAQSASMFSYKKSEKAINALIHYSKKEIARQTDILYKEPVYAEYMLNISGTKTHPIYELYFKMGKDYLYVTKNSSQLIDDIMNEEDIVFGKNFTFTPEDYALMPEDRRVFELLSEIQTVIKAVLPMGYENQFLNKDSFTIPPTYIKEVLKRLDKTMGAFVRFGRPPRQASQADRGEALLIEEDLSAA